jgi:predicted MFS family arabinose efflux permease
VLLALPAGAMADLVDRRRWLIMTQGLILAIALLAGLVEAADALGPLSLLALTSLLGIGFALQQPAAQAVVTEVVPRDELPQALALNGISFNVSRVAGPALAGALIAWGGGLAVYAAVALCCAYMLVFLWRWRGVTRRSVAPPEQLWGALRNGLRYVQHSPNCRRQLLHLAMFMASGSATWALLPVVARDVFGLQQGGYGLMLGAFGVGGILAALVLPALRKRSMAHHIVAASACGFALVTAVLVLPVPLWVALAALVFGGVAWTCGVSSIYAAFQTDLADWVRSRGIAVYNLIYFAAMAGGAALWGGLTQALGTRSAMWLAAAALMGAAAWHLRSSLHPTGQRGGADASAGHSSPVWGGPDPTIVPASEDNALVIQISYRVRPEATAQFRQRARDVGQSCRRNGAAFWRLYQDLDDPSLYVERYVVDSWSDLLRQRERMSSYDHALRSGLESCLVPGTTPVLARHAVLALAPVEPETASTGT